MALKADCRLTIFTPVYNRAHCIEKSAQTEEPGFYLDYCRRRVC